jgi:hypothetical protein
MKKVSIADIQIFDWLTISDAIIKNIKQIYLNAKNIQVVIFIVINIIISSCTHVYYIPKALNVPLFREKNEFRGSVSYGFDEEFSSTDVQAAYAVTDNFAVMTNYMFSNGGHFYEKNKAKLNYFDGAAGYFKTIDNLWVFEIYGGFGAGSQHHEYYTYHLFSTGNYTFDGTSDLSFTKSFLQPSFGITLNMLDVGLSSCFSILNFNKLDNAISINSIYYGDLHSISQDIQSFLFEPALTVRAGWKYIKLQVQYIYSFNLTNPDLLFQKSKLGFGISFSFGKKYADEEFKKPLAEN